MRLLVVEDELELRERLSQTLSKAGFAVDTAADGRDGLFMATEYPFDLAIVDLGLPEISGMELIKKMREAGKEYPVLILTARDDWQDKVEGLSAGADDYVTKPFQMEEVLARVNALLRRAAGYSRPEISHGPLKMDTMEQRVYLQDKEIDLTAYEYKVLEYFMLNPGKVVSKTELTEHIYAEDQDRDSNVLEVFIGRLRKKIDPDSITQPIETLRGRGYRFDTKRLTDTP